MKELQRLGISIYNRYMIPERDKEKFENILRGKKGNLEDITMQVDPLELIKNNVKHYI